MENLNYLFNVRYYSQIPFTHKHFGKCNDTIINQTFNSGNEEIPFINENSFTLRTVYPGLLIGIGNTHEAGLEKSGDEKEGAEIKLGFSLDYVTGLPIIPGSTVKGVLRSAFENYSEYVADVLASKTAADVYVADLTKCIFGNPDQGLCVFYDALPVKTAKDERLLRLDNITPHNKPYDVETEGGGEEYKMNGLKNPIPLTMLKVMPGVTYLFRFDLSRIAHKGIDHAVLKSVFKEVLMDLGIGAKTNVGYGVMEEPDNTDIPTYMLVPYVRSEKCESQLNAHEGVCVICGKETKTIKSLEERGIIKYHEKCFLCNQKQRGGV